LRRTRPLTPPKRQSFSPHQRKNLQRKNLPQKNPRRQPPPAASTQPAPREEATGTSVAPTLGPQPRWATVKPLKLGLGGNLPILSDQPDDEEMKQYFEKLASGTFYFTFDTSDQGEIVLVIFIREVVSGQLLFCFSCNLISYFHFCTRCFRMSPPQARAPNGRSASRYVCLLKTHTIWLSN